MKILLGSKEYLRAVDKDFQFGFGLKNNRSFYQEEELTKIVDELSQFNSERNSNYNYLLYGKLEYLIDDEVNNSKYFLNQTNYDISVGYIDRFQPLVEDMIKIISIEDDLITIEGKNVEINDVILTFNDSFIVNKVLERYENEDIVTIKLDNMSGVTVSTKIVPSIAHYNRYYKEIISEDFLRLYNSAYSINIFEDPILQYNTYKDINIEGYKDNFNNPLTSLFFRVKPKYNSTNVYKSDPTKNIIDDLIIDKVKYNLNELTYEIVDVIMSSFSDNITQFYFNSYFENPVRLFSSVVTNSNIENMFSVPDNGFKFKNGDVLYKDILQIGSFEDNVGLDYPYINNLHYLYKDMKFFIRRVVPIAKYDDLSQGTIDDYDDTLINDDITTKRLC